MAINPQLGTNYRPPVTVKSSVSLFRNLSQTVNAWTKVLTKIGENLYLRKSLLVYT